MKKGDIVSVIAGGTINRGDFVKSDSLGRAIAVGLKIEPDEIGIAAGKAEAGEMVDIVLTKITQDHLADVKKLVDECSDVIP